MKSIKEKAEEYAFIKQGIDPAGIQFREFDTNKQDGFVAGANYVLDEIESLIKNVSDEYSLFQQGIIIHVRLIKLLEQLKK